MVDRVAIVELLELACDNDSFETAMKVRCSSIVVKNDPSGVNITVYIR